MHEATTKQSTAEVYEAMGISMDDPPKKGKARRGQRGNRGARSEKRATASAKKAASAASSGSTPLTLFGEYSAARQVVAQVMEETTSSSNDGSDDDVKYHAQGTMCVRCLENGYRTPAQMNGYTGAVLCLACTHQFFDPNKLDAACAPGRVVVVDASFPEPPPPPEKEAPRNWKEDEESFGSDYEPKPVLSPAQLHKELGLDFEEKKTLLKSKADVAMLMMSKQ